MATLQAAASCSNVSQLTCSGVPSSSSRSSSSSVVSWLSPSSKFSTELRLSSVSSLSQSTSVLQNSWVVSQFRREAVRPGKVGAARAASEEKNVLIINTNSGGHAVIGSFRPVEIPEGSVSVILLAGGKGKRMGANMPKQYLPLLGQPIALHSFHTFSVMAVVGEIIVVCDPSYRDIFEDEKISTPMKFALPGKERQDSVWSGLQEISKTAKLVCIHDSARPLVRTSDILKVISDAWVHGAAVLGVPCKATIKEAGRDQFVRKTLDRRTLWEMQTPQVIEPELLRKGFELVERERLEVTDDVSIVEYLKHPVLITEGCYTNLKVTTPDDLLVAERILHQRSNSITSGSALPVVSCT